MHLVAQALRSYRWMFLLRGMLAILFGILALAWPGDYADRLGVPVWAGQSHLKGGDKIGSKTVEKRTWNTSAHWIWKPILQE